MIKCKNKIIVFVLCVFLFSARPSHSQWPVFDFSEIKPLVTDVKTGIESFQHAKDQLMQLKNSLMAIGEKLATIASFVKNLADILSNIIAAVSGALNAIKSALVVDLDISDGVYSAVDETDDSAEEIIIEYVDISDTVVIDNDMMNSGNLDIEEEEEEEEISSFVKIEEYKEAILNQITNNMISAINESEKIKNQFNDYLSSSIMLLNESYDIKMQEFDKISISIDENDIISSQDKDIIKQDIALLKSKVEEMSNYSISSIEIMKDEYNAFYNNNILDGINNHYKNTVNFLNGDISKEQLETSGANLKKNVKFASLARSFDFREKLHQDNKDIEKDMNEIKAKLINFENNMDNVK